MAGKKANKKQVHPHLSGVQKAVVSFANMFEKNRRINREAQRVIKEKHLKKSGLYFMEKEVGGLKSVSSVLTSSSCHPKIFIKEFCNFLVPCHQHCLRVNVLVQR